MKKFLLSLFFVVVGSYVYANNDIGLAKKTEIDKELVRRVVTEVKEKYLEGLLNHFFSDIDVLINQLTLFSRNMQLDSLDESSKEQLISYYKRFLVNAHYLRGLNLLSEGTKEFLIFTVLTSFESFFSNPTQLNKFLNNKDLATVLFFASAFGLEFEYCNDLKNIINYIKERCSFLENEDLEDIRYECTISEILNQLSKEINQYGVFSKITEKIFQSSILRIKEKIENSKSDTKKIKGKKNKK
jgi:hypothetical protein